MIVFSLVIVLVIAIKREVIIAIKTNIEEKNGELFNLFKKKRQN